MNHQLIDLMLRTKVIAIVRGLDGGMEPLVQALYDGGIRMVEVTFNQKQEAPYRTTTQAIRAIRACMGEKMAVGAGTVVTEQQAELAFEAGAQFMVSPDTNPDVIRRAKALGLVTMPGALTPSEILTAHEAGADFVKIFPAGVLGAGYIKAICAPLNHIRLLAVGGVNEKNAAEFLKAGCVGVGVGGNLVNREWIAQEQYEKITQTARALCSAVQEDGRMVK